MKHHFHSGAVRAAIIAAVSVGTGSLGNAAGLEKGQTEAGAVAGIVSGIGTHGTIGVQAATGVTERIAAYGELSFIPGGGGNSSFGGVTSTASARALNLNGGIHYQFGAHGKAVPYAAAGLGVLRSSASYRSSGAGVDIRGSASATNLYFNFGGGLRYYVKDNWGFRPELMIFAGDQTYVRLGVGIFYEFGK
ncbi:MAG: outer membrane beta-barrel protein [Bryobacteraceae bacterium]